MQIQSGKLYENRTWNYLYPCLKYYGNDLMDKLSSFFKLAVGVGDVNRTEEGNCIYILVDTDLPLMSETQREDYKRKFAKFLDWLSYKDYYVTDYVFEDIDKSDKHMVVLRLPKIYDITYVNFVKGNYSVMYSPKVINDYFKYINIQNKEVEVKRNQKLKEIRQVLTKDKNYVSTFVAKVNKDFATDVSTKHFMDAELDYPPKKEEEIFNYEVQEAQVAS